MKKNVGIFFLGLSWVLFLVMPKTFAACPDWVGDLDGSNSVTVTDVQCGVLTALAALSGDGFPECLAGGLAASDINCDGLANVIDVHLTIVVALGLSFASEIDANNDGCPDACGCSSECTWAQCGDDGCGGSCGVCKGGDCQDGQCVPWQVVCPNVPDPTPVSNLLLPTLSPAGTPKTIKNGSFTDDYLDNGSGYIEIGIRREWGATIIFYGLAAGKPGTNTIDANDTGREVQVAFYDPDRIMQGCAYNASCQTNPSASCPGSITYLGWNPVQGGNECNIGSGVEQVLHGPGVLLTQVRPLHWNPDWQESTCTNGGCGDPAKKNLLSDVRYTQRLRFVDPHIVEMEMRVDNLSSVHHGVTAQEFPTLYAAYGAGGTPDLQVLLNSAGQQVQIDQPANDGFFFKQFVSPGPWVTLQNTAQNYGVGIYYENRLAEFQGWQKKGVFNNVRSVFPFGIAANGNVSARAYLMLGSFQTIAGLAATLDAKLPPFGAVDSPTANAVVNSGQVVVSGWALDNKGVVSVHVRLDGVQLQTMVPNLSRPDVCQAWPGYGACPLVGFSGTVSLAGVTPCAHILEISAKDADGNERVLNRFKITVQGGQPCVVDVDCDDGDPCTNDICGTNGCVFTNVAPGSMGPESCNGNDDDCDGAVDEPDAVGCSLWYADGDKDGWGAGVGQCVCGTTGMLTTNKTGDCVDSNPGINPGAAEVCNKTDDDCDGATDEGANCPVTAPIYRLLWVNGQDTDHKMSKSPAATGGYLLEGVATELYAQPGPGLVPLYQVYCAACTDHMTTLVAGEGAPAYGAQELLGYCSPVQTAATPNHFRRMWSVKASDHLTTKDPNEWVTAQQLGYSLETGCWVP